MSKPLVSILIVSYNYGRFIQDAIDSVLAQQFALDQIEILVVDDGSTDDTSKQVKKYGSQVTYLYKENGGQASALNYGLARASGEIVTLLDADDYFLPGKLARIAEAFASDPDLGMVYHRIELWHPDTGKREGWDFVEVSGDLRTEPRRFELYLTPPNLAISFRRRFLNQLLPIPENIRMLADCYISALIPFHARVLAIPEVLATYRIHGKNSYTTGQPEALEVKARKVQMWQTVIAAMRQWLADNGYSFRQQPVRAMTEKWDVILEREAFTVNPPTRIHFFRHLLKSYRYRTRLMKRNLLLLNYLDAVGALIVGYEKFPSWLEKREHVLRGVRGVLRKKLA